MTTETRTATAAIRAKAERLLADDRVRQVKGYVFEVVGDHGIYTVTVGYAQEASGACIDQDGQACRGMRPVCSHLFAACVWVLANPAEPAAYNPPGDPFAGLN